MKSALQYYIQTTLIFICNAVFEINGTAQPAFSRFYNFSDSIGFASIASDVTSLDREILVFGVFISPIENGQGLYFAKIDYSGVVTSVSRQVRPNQTIFPATYKGIHFRNSKFYLFGTLMDRSINPNYGVYYPIIFKLDSLGNKEAEITYKDSINSHIANAVFMHQNGAYTIAGFGGFDFYDTGNSAGFTFVKSFVAHFDSLGNELWRTYPLTSHSATKGHIETYSIDSAHGNGYVVSAWKQHQQQYDNFFYKVDSTGQVAWIRNYGSPQDDHYGCYILRSNYGGYIFGGHYTDSIYPQAGPFYYNYYYGRLDDNGDTLWTRQFGTPERANKIRRIMEMPNGDLIFLGYLWSDYSRSVAFKTNQSGDVLWSREYVMSNYYSTENQLLAIDATTDGRLVFGGILTSFHKVPGILDTIGQFSWIVLTDTAGCIDPGCDSLDSSHSNLVIIDPLAGFQLFPNPTKGYFKADMENFQHLPEVYVELYDLFGRLQKRKNATAESHVSMNMVGLPAGTYIVRISSNGFTLVTRKLIIQP